MLYFDLRPGPKILFQGNTPEGSDTFQRPVIEKDRVGVELLFNSVEFGVPKQLPADSQRVRDEMW